MRSASLLLAAALLATSATASSGQRLSATRLLIPDTSGHRLPAPVIGLLSAAVPGAGEYALHLDRWLPRVAVEAYAWWEYRAHRREARDYERHYRVLACEVSRRIVPGECRDTSEFEYYEQMGRWDASGSFDSNPTISGLQPESDPSTYNGDVWRLAQLKSATTSAAVAFYEAHAIPPSYRWYWGDNTLEQTVYRELIRRGDDAFRSSTRILGLVMANHVTSAVDAFIAARLGELAAGRSINVQTGLMPAGADFRWEAQVRVGTGRP